MIISSSACKKCSKCCQNFPCIELSKEDIKRLEECVGLSFEEFTNPKDKVFTEDYFLQFQKNGDCIFLEAKDGGHSCKVYSVRPKVCKSYPSNPKQKAFCDVSMSV